MPGKDKTDNRKSKKSGLFQLPRKLRIVHIIVLASLVSTVLIEVVWLVPSMMGREEDLLKRLEEKARLMINASIDDTLYQDIAKTETIGRRLAAIGVIKGGSIFDNSGNRIGSFGERPALTASLAWQEGIKRYRTPDNCCLDFHMPPHETGLKHTLVLRLDAQEISTDLTAFLKKSGGIIVFITITVTLSISVILYFTIAIPIVRMRDTVRTAFKETHLETDGFGLDWKRRDELGELANSFEKLLTAMNGVYRNELHASYDSFENAPFGIIHFDTNGDIMTVNSKALDFLFADTPHDLIKRDEFLICFDEECKDGAVEIENTFAWGNYVREAFIMTPFGETPCVLSMVAQKNADGKVIRYVLNITDTSEYERRIARHENNLRIAKNEEKLYKYRFAEMKLILESAMVLLQNMQQVDSPPEQAVIMSPEVMLNSWKQISYMSDINASVTSPELLPPVIGGEKSLREMFNYALAVVALNTNYEGVHLGIDAVKIAGGYAEFTITDNKEEKHPPRIEESCYNKPWQLPLAALTATLEKSGGRLTKADMENNIVSFVLPTSIEVMRKINPDMVPEIEPEDLTEMLKGSIPGIPDPVEPSVTEPLIVEPAAKTQEPTTTEKEEAIEPTITGDESLTVEPTIVGNSKIVRDAAIVEPTIIEEQDVVEPTIIAESDEDVAA
jgi:PAS domain-containing protein